MDGTLKFMNHLEPRRRLYIRRPFLRKSMPSAAPVSSETLHEYGVGVRSGLCATVVLCAGIPKSEVIRPFIRAAYSLLAFLGYNARPIRDSTEDMMSGPVSSRKIQISLQVRRQPLDLRPAT
jgi:hypothetical protein